MSEETTTLGIGTRTTARRPGRPSTAETAELSREDRQKWIAAVDIATLDEPGLPTIPAMEGMEQRWVRVKVKNDPDVRNLVAKERRGWRPRPAQTVARAYQNLRIAEGDYAGCIGFHDVVLFHRPVEIGEKVRKIELQKVREKELAIRSMQFRETEGQDRDKAYFQHENPELRSRVETGEYREVEIPD